MNYEKHESAPAYMTGYSSATDYYMSRASRMAVAQGETEERFRAACKAGDVSASIATWAHAHCETLTDAICHSLDFATGPTHAEAYQLILDAANGKNIEAKAQRLVDRMAAKWADYNTPEVDE